MTVAKPGQTQRQVAVESVDLSQGFAMTREATTGNRTKVPLLPSPTGIWPQVGQAWLLNKTTAGGWTFAALLGGPRYAVAGSSPLALMRLSSAATGQALATGSTQVRLPLDTVAKTQGTGLEADLVNDRIYVRKPGSYVVESMVGLIVNGAGGLRTANIVWHHTLANTDEVIGPCTGPGLNATQTSHYAKTFPITVPKDDYFSVMCQQTSGQTGTFSNVNNSMWLQVREQGEDSPDLLAALVALGLVADQTV